MNERTGTMVIDTVVIGAGQAGLATGYHLSRQGAQFVILDAGERVGDTWRRRWDSLRLFTPARYDGLPGRPFPAPAWTFPTKDEYADYLESYATGLGLPVLSGCRVDRLERHGGRYLVRAGERHFVADSVVVAMANYQRPHVPAFAGELGPEIGQLHSAEYRNPGQLRPGPVLIVGAGNSGSEIAMELARERTVLMAGRDTGHLPFRIEGAAARLLFVRLVLGLVFHQILRVDTPPGRRLRPKLIGHGGPLIRVKPADLRAAGVERVSRVAGVRDGLPVLADGRRLEVSNVVWCTGYDPDLSWVDLPISGEHEPLHRAGLALGHPGLYFVGLHFQYALSSAMIHGVSRDAERIANTIAARGRERAPVADRAPAGSAVRTPGS